MIPNQITESVLALSEGERLELARWIVERVDTERRIAASVDEGVRRIEEVVTGRVSGLSEEEYRRAIG